MDSILNSPLFGILLSLVTFEIGLFVNKKTKFPLLNPMIISIGMIILILSFFNINIKSYNVGGNLISFFLGPATVILAVPLYKQIELLKSNSLAILIGILVGCITSIVSVLTFYKLLGLDKTLALSLIPKSITTPIGIEISKSLGGIIPITVTAIIVTGIIGCIISPFILKLFKITDEVAIGVALGTSSHALGTTKALEMGEIQGAMSGLSIGIAGLLTVVITFGIANLIK